MHFKKFTLFVTLTLTPTLSFALFCPTNFSQINVGDTIDQVTQQCGKPDKQDTKEAASEGPQEWNYFIPQTVASDSLTPEQGTLKTQITFDANNKAINISVNGIGVGSSTICKSPIQLGDSREAIKSACGDPSFINKQNGSSNALGTPPPPTTITTMLYNSNPPATLVFENGLFKEKK